MTRGGSALTLLVLGACGAHHVDAPVGVPLARDAVVVPYPPPPAKVEELPPSPSPRCVWTDGYWELGERWEWVPGGYVVPPPHCRLAPLQLYRQGGELHYARPRWYPDAEGAGGDEAAASPSCAAPTPCTSSEAESGSATAAGQ